MSEHDATWIGLDRERVRLEAIPAERLTYIEASRLEMLQRIQGSTPRDFAKWNRSRHERLTDWLLGRDPAWRGPRYPWPDLGFR